jgi:hypothetical protein
MTHLLLLVGVDRDESRAMLAGDQVPVRPTARKSLATTRIAARPALSLGGPVVA